ncbi:MAG TPA: arginine N-succinyltransferase [Paucimonas sp.]|nr:arginine N-succinyltransferase [Paucimonas sp.]
MFVVRPVETKDIPALAELGKVATRGVHTFPKTPSAIERAVERSIASFAAQVEIPSEESYFFVLESSRDRSIAGAAAISATAGSAGTFFAFRNDVIHQVSRDLNISHSVHVLTLCSDLTSCSQLSSFFVRDQQAAGQETALLSRARLLFAAAAPHRFGEKFFASLAGMTDANGRSAFWEALGRKFFQMDYLEAERLVEGARNRTLIVELMPHYPIYVPLLPGEAQAAMGQVHPEGELPFRMLSEEGFEPDEFIDIFDGGPILRAHKHALRSFSSSARREVAYMVTPDDTPKTSYLVCNAREAGFRAVIAECPRLESAESIVLSPEAMRCLDVVNGDAVLCVKL